MVQEVVWWEVKEVWLNVENNEFRVPACRYYMFRSFCHIKSKLLIKLHAECDKRDERTKKNRNKNVICTLQS